jgi:tRNA U54 and U55 pseudouridine synthase Pus10
MANHVTTHDIEADGKKYILEWVHGDNGRIAITECSEEPDEIEMLEAYDFDEVTS